MPNILEFFFSQKQPRSLSFEEEFPLHNAAYCEDIDRVTMLLSSCSDVNRVDDEHAVPILYAMGRMTIRQVSIKIIILLLRAGADPGIPSKMNTTALFWAFDKNNLALARLLLWSRPDYENLPVPLRKKKFASLDSYIDAREHAEKYYGFCRNYHAWIRYTAADAKQVKALEVNASRCVQEKNYLAAEKIYLEISEIYRKHQKLEEDASELLYSKQEKGKTKHSFPPEEIERKLIYPFNIDDLEILAPLGVPPRLVEYKPLLVAFYENKVLDCHEKIFSCYEQWDRDCGALLHPDLPVQLNILEKLLELGKRLKKPQQILGVYLKRAAEILIQMPAQRVGVAVNRDRPLVEVTAEESDDELDGKETTALLQTSRSALQQGQYSGMFGALRRRRPDGRSPESEALATADATLVAQFYPGT